MTVCLSHVEPRLWLGYSSTKSSAASCTSPFPFSSSFAAAAVSVPLIRQPRGSNGARTQRPLTVSGSVQDPRRLPAAAAATAGTRLADSKLPAGLASLDLGPRQQPRVNISGPVQDATSLWEEWRQKQKDKLGMAARIVELSAEPAETKRQLAEAQAEVMTQQPNGVQRLSNHVSASQDIPQHRGVQGFLSEAALPSQDIQTFLSETALACALQQAADAEHKIARMEKELEASRKAHKSSMERLAFLERDAVRLRGKEEASKMAARVAARQGKQLAARLDTAEASRKAAEMQAQNLQALVDEIRGAAANNKDFVVDISAAVEDASGVLEGYQEQMALMEALERQAEQASALVDELTAAQQMLVQAQDAMSQAAKEAQAGEDEVQVFLTQVAMETVLRKEEEAEQAVAALEAELGAVKRAREDALASLDVMKAEMQALSVQKAEQEKAARRASEEARRLAEQLQTAQESLAASTGQVSVLVVEAERLRKKAEEDSLSMTRSSRELEVLGAKIVELQKQAERAKAAEFEVCALQGRLASLEEELEGRVGKIGMEGGGEEATAETKAEVASAELQLITAAGSGTVKYSQGERLVLPGWLHRGWEFLVTADYSVLTHK